jgi:hypothetical protein
VDPLKGATVQSVRQAIVRRDSAAVASQGNGNNRKRGEDHQNQSAQVGDQDAVLEDHYR